MEIFHYSGNVPKELSFYSKKMLGELPSKINSLFQEICFGYFLDIWFKISVLANDIMGNAISNLAGCIQMTNEAVQRTARQSVHWALATAVSTSGACTIFTWRFMDASGFSKIRAAGTCSHCWPNNNALIYCKCRPDWTHNKSQGLASWLFKD